ncbi:MAG: RsmB/NOP family class I SAM-dependent RNA methyltransferase [Ignavibacteriales bacterium]|nr:Ribosomal RNA small subunit methyltransferase F [Ignavibacteriaceae bacterium]MBW7872470.1 RsmB/NOP family class I SAM-dependent RNA methyltransferase [Ignavibacteria bacterium]MBZ0197592.1 RsmB/NOP family class I SAM-dependent RNA methyltransferase [Ignavibacteriaceae bacterium]MCZ2141977.1 RsmB/NOP family class I SAM-dependent RNA methyltransferase [Ignavibacteriales bacterium]WKZ73754.1 MAG: RsmB/NOP family class I SAM-dependent RNA methyltransferase [Ignavibacteriaceae bacterium]
MFPITRVTTKKSSTRKRKEFARAHGSGANAGGNNSNARQNSAKTHGNGANAGGKNHKAQGSRQNGLLNEHISDYLLKLFGENELNRYIELLGSPRKLAIRVNTLKTTTERLQPLLEKKYSILSSLAPNLPNALLIESDPSNLIGKSFEHLLGYYYIQSTSSMYPLHILQPKPGEKVLDLCAAPGSKSTQIAAMMENKGMLVVNEVQSDRLRTLAYNIERMNVVNAGVIQNKGEWLGGYFQNYFDKILVDVPCSGLGILQKKDEVNKWWSISSISRLLNLQLSLIIAAVKMLKPGGELVYSTCTLTTEENEEIVNKVIEKYPVELLPVSIPGSVEGFTKAGEKILSGEMRKTARILPWSANSEGFFIAKMTKTAPTEEIKQSPVPEARTTIKPYKKVKEHFSSLISNFGISQDFFDSFLYPDHGKRLFMISKDWEDNRTGIYERIGLKIGAYDKSNQLILSSIAAQTWAKYITKGIIDLDEPADLQTYMEGGVIREYSSDLKNSGAERQVVIRNNGEIIGTGVLTEKGLKSRFPRGHRNQNFSF